MYTGNDPLLQLISRDEGWRSEPYKDSLGYWTIGVGHLIDRRLGGELPSYIRSFPLNDLEILALLEMDVVIAKNNLFKPYPWVKDLDEIRRNVVISMCFQLGIKKLHKFVNTMRYLEQKDWVRAAAQIRNSKVAKTQAPARWERFAQMVEKGVFV